MKQTVVTLITATKLSADQKKQVLSELEPKLGSVELDEVVDPSVMGGLKIKLGNQEFDATLAGKLQRLESQVPEVQVITAIELSTDQRSKIKKALETKLGPIALIEKIDSSIIGGIRIIAGSREIDATVKGRLTRLKNTLSQTL
jgi:F0F1-type ATP synthase delta subunit